MTRLVTYITRCPRWRHHTGLTLAIAVVTLCATLLPDWATHSSIAAIFINAFWIWSE